jgi:hypothetical protein
MGIFGRLIGQGLGALGSKIFPVDGVDGEKLGGSIGNLLPFNRGGQIPENAYARGGMVKKVKAKYFQRGKKSKKRSKK